MFPIFAGFFMGIADLIPGVSGGTIAFILGIYEPFIEGLGAISLSHIKDIFCGRLAKVYREVNGSLLLKVFFGIALAMSSLAGLFHLWLNDPVAKSYLFSAFFGFILGSVAIVNRRIRRFNLATAIALFVGALFAAALVLLPKGGALYLPSSGFDPMLIVFGALASSAMLLPGISGSYLLTIVGIYPVAVMALASALQAASLGELASAELVILFQLLIGIILGATLFSRVIKLLLTKAHDLTLSLLIGFMVGALPAVWPFFDSEVSIFGEERLLSTVKLLLPDPFHTTCWISAGVVIFSYGLVTLFDKISLYRAKSSSI